MMNVLDIPNLRRAVSLKKHSTYRVGGEAKFFYEAHDRPSLERAVLAARADGLPCYILGGGTNTLAPDAGFDGLLIKMMMNQVGVLDETIYAEAGVSMGVLVNRAKALGLSGLEWAAGLPGTLGGAIYGNAGSCGGETADVVVSIETFNSEDKTFRRYVKYQCDFRYRHSIFKEKKEVILGAVLKLQKSDPETVMKKMVDNMKFRAEHQPLADRSAGCAFKNVELAVSPSAAYLANSDFEFTRFRNARFLPAGLLIDKAGLKGMKIGGAAVSELHGNFIVVSEGAKGEDILWILKIIKNKIMEKYNIALEEEIRLISG